MLLRIPWRSAPPTNPLDEHQALSKRFLALAFYGENNLIFVLICILQYNGVKYNFTLSLESYNAHE